MSLMQQATGRSILAMTIMILALIFMGSLPTSASARPKDFHSSVTLTNHAKSQTAKFQTSSKMHNHHVAKLSAASPGFAKLSKSLEKWAAADPKLKLKDIKISYDTPLRGSALTRFKASIRAFVAAKWVSIRGTPDGGACH